ncbi:MAG: YqiJ family protein [Chloroflexi bacterium]|nr:YqiJ family protein [Chloroflexota bacterium]MCI0574868.1 YqiJ family protein [Chloroflexota bacterium]MCI0650102.1 YqiJ family protein [Chloroflexota bacterium]MCI0731186.1 YqiJ family protein [Chloroflexota bacterium]
MLRDAWLFISAWYNLPFTFLLGTCVFLTALQLVGLGGEQDGDLDADFDADVDADLDLDADLDADVDADLDLDADADVDVDADAEADLDADHGDFDADGVPSALAALAYLGVGKAPLMVVLVILFGSIGLAGWFLNSIVEGVLGAYPAVAFAAVLPVALVSGSLVSSRTARLIGRALPPISTTATPARALVGQIGVVTSPAVDEKYGMVRLRDSGGTMISVFAVVEGEEPIGRASDVVLVDYDPQQKRYTVTRSS